MGTAPPTKGSADRGLSASASRHRGQVWSEGCCLWVAQRQMARCSAVDPESAAIV
jgi:hypothetical protein